MDEKISKSIRICNRDSGSNDCSLFSNKNETVIRYAVTLKKKGRYVPPIGKDKYKKSNTIIIKNLT